MRYQCIIFILKNNENFLTENVDNLIDLSNHFDLIFVTRESKDRTNQILKSNNFFNIPLSYDPGYYEALKAGFEFVKNMKYVSWIEFGEVGKIQLNEIMKLSDINEEFEYKKSVIFASRYWKKPMRTKIITSMFLGKKISDPYTRFKIYNAQTFDILKNVFQYKMYPENFINLLCNMPDFVEVKTKRKKPKKKQISYRKKFLIKSKFMVYLIFILPFTKKHNK